MTDANDITKETLQFILDGLKNQEGIERHKTSQTLLELKEWIDANEKSDPFICPPDKKTNPWNDKSGKCVLQ